MSAAQFVNFKRTDEAAVQGRELRGESLSYNVLLRKSTPRISDYI